MSSVTGSESRKRTEDGAGECTRAVAVRGGFAGGGADPGLSGKVGARREEGREPELPEEDAIVRSLRSRFCTRIQRKT